MEFTKTGSCGNAWGKRKTIRMRGLKGIGSRASTYASGIVIASVSAVTTTAMRKPSVSARSRSPWSTLAQ